MVRMLLDEILVMDLLWRMDTSRTVIEHRRCSTAETLLSHGAIESVVSTKPTKER